MTKYYYLCASALVATLVSTPVSAQLAQPPEAVAVDAEAGRIPDIVVTAQRRRETLQRVPIAVSAFSASQLQAQGVSNTLQLGNFVPNLVALNNTGIGSANTYFLRGLGSVESIATADPPVGTYVDDIYLSRQNANNVSLFDVERVEVLRGPQGTLFGRNTTGGAINVIMREPGDEFGGYAEVGYGRYDKRIARASVDVPLAPTLSVKLSGYWQNDDGYVKNTTTGQRLNDDDGWGVRLGIKGQLTDSSTVTASYAHIVADGENLLNYNCDPANPSNCKGRFATTGYTEENSATRYAALNIRGEKATYGLGNHTATDLVTLKLDLGVAEDMRLSLITGYVNLIQQYGLDFFDGRPSGPSLANPSPALTRNPRGSFVVLNDSKTEQISEEIKLTGKLGDGLIDYVAGLFYLREDSLTDFADVLGGASLLADRILRNTAEAKAGYVQADLNVTDQIKLTAGVRYTDEKKFLTFTDNRANCGTNCLTNANMIANGTRIPDHQRTKIWTPRFAVNYTPTRDLLLFASATRGFKSGGWNARGYTNASLLPFDAEKVWSYEAGFKSDLFDRRVRFNLTAFYLDVSKLQGLTAITAASGALTFITRNFADYRNKGLEAELTVVPLPGLNLYANAGYQDDKFKIDQNAPAFDVYGVQSVAAQIAACQAALAAGRVPTVANPAGSPASSPNGANCGAGIVTANGELATPPRTPKFTLAFGGTYSVDLGDSGMTLVPSVNASFRVKQEVSTSNLSVYLGPISGTNGPNGSIVTYPANPNSGTFVAGSYSPSVWLINAGLTLNGPDKRWSLSANCTNCFNEARPISALSNTTYLNPPMAWMLTARHNF